MSVTALFAGVLLAQAAPLALVQNEPARVDVAYEDMSQGRNEAAISHILANRALAEDPAALINLGTASARMGDAAKARDYYNAAATSRTVVYLELADGSWMDSRRAARAAMDGLAKGAFAAR